MDTSSSGNEPGGMTPQKTAERLRCRGLLNATGTADGAKLVKLLILGNTGCGKSLLCNALLGEEIFSHRAQQSSVTAENSFAIADIDETTYIVCNVPGLLESDESNIPRNKAAIEAAFKFCPDVLTVVLFVMTGAQGGRVTHEDITAVSTVKKFVDIPPEACGVLVNRVDVEELDLDLDAYRVDSIELIRRVLEEDENLVIDFVPRMPRRHRTNFESTAMKELQQLLKGLISALQPRDMAPAKNARLVLERDQLRADMDRLKRDLESRQQILEERRRKRRTQSDEHMATMRKATKAHVPKLLTAFGIAYERSSAAAVRNLIMRAVREADGTAEQNQAQRILLGALQRGGISLGVSAVADIFLRLSATAAVPKLSVTAMISAERVESDSDAFHFSRLPFPAVHQPAGQLVWLTTSASGSEEEEEEEGPRRGTQCMGFSETAIPTFPPPHVATIMHTAATRQLTFAAGDVSQRVKRAVFFASLGSDGDGRARVRRLSGDVTTEGSDASGMPARIFPIVVANSSNFDGSSEFLINTLATEALRIAVLQQTRGGQPGDQGDPHCSVVTVIGDAAARRQHVAALLQAEGLSLPPALERVTVKGVWAYLVPSGGSPLVILEPEAALVPEAFATHMASTVRYVADPGRPVRVWDATRLWHALYASVMAADEQPIACKDSVIRQIAITNMWPTVVSLHQGPVKYEDDAAHSLMQEFVTLTATSVGLASRVCEHNLTAEEYAERVLAKSDTIFSAVSGAVEQLVADDLGLLARKSASVLDGQLKLLLDHTQQYVNGSDDAEFEAEFSHWQNHDLLNMCNTAEDSEAVSLLRIAEVFMRLVKLLKDYDKHTDNFFLSALIILATSESGENVPMETSWPCVWIREFQKDTHGLIAPWRNNLVLSRSAAWRFAAIIIDAREEFALWLMVESPWFMRLLARKVAAEGIAAVPESELAPEEEEETDDKDHGHALGGAKTDAHAAEARRQLHVDPAAAA